MTSLSASMRFAFLALLLSGSMTASAQDGFGTLVAASSDEIIALKPGTYFGSAAVLVFRSEGGQWRVTRTLQPIDPGPGEGFGYSMALAGDVLLVAAADPATVWGAHAYHRTDGQWTPAARIPLKKEATPPAAGATPGEILDFAGLMAFAEPTRRVVALSSDGSTAAIGRARPGLPEVVILRRGASASEWIEEARVVPDSIPGPLELAVSRDRLIVGMPDREGSGAVIVYSRSRDGGWSDGMMIRPSPDPGEGGGFGAAVSFDGEHILVGMPGAGAVLSYALRVSGEVSPGHVLRADGTDAAMFGASIAVDGNELLIGAPLAAESAGEVHRFVRNRPGEPWRNAGILTAEGSGAPVFLGAAVAIGEAGAAAGAPGGTGSRGVVHVWSRSVDGGRVATGLLTAGGELTSRTGAVVDCAGNRAAGFECANVDLLAFVSIADLGGEPGEQVTDLWGWSDPETQREYALVGRDRGIAIVDVTDPNVPRYLGVVQGPPASPRDIKVYRDHMFFTGDGSGEHGLLVFDLTRVRELTGSPPVPLEPDVRYADMARAHNLVMDVEGGTAIPVGSSGGGNTCGGGLHLVDVSNPREPSFAGCYTDTEGLVWQGRTHDAQCTRYRGPDKRYAGRNICFIANETALRIVDISDRAAPQPISKGTYPNRGYVHQGWLTEDQRYFFMNDEADEVAGLTPRTRTLIWDVADLDDPVLAGEFLGPDAATDHNLFIHGDLMYLANYQAGMRVVDISDPLNPVELGFFDTTPYPGNPAGWGGGAWSAWPFLESGTVLVSSIHEGLFLLRPKRVPTVSVSHP